jgi:hypothetical protein
MTKIFNKIGESLLKVFTFFWRLSKFKKLSLIVFYTLFIFDLSFGQSTTAVDPSFVASTTPTEEQIRLEVNAFYSNLLSGKIESIELQKYKKDLNKFASTTENYLSNFREIDRLLTDIDNKKIQNSSEIKKVIQDLDSQRSSLFRNSREFKKQKSNIFKKIIKDKSIKPNYLLLYKLDSKFNNSDLDIFFDDYEKTYYNQIVTYRVFYEYLINSKVKYESINQDYYFYDIKSDLQYFDFLVGIRKNKMEIVRVRMKAMRNLLSRENSLEIFESNRSHNNQYVMDIYDLFFGDIYLEDYGLIQTWKGENGLHSNRSDLKLNNFFNERFSYLDSILLATSKQKGGLDNVPFFVRDEDFPSLLSNKDLIKKYIDELSILTNGKENIISTITTDLKKKTHYFDNSLTHRQIVINSSYKSFDHFLKEGSKFYINVKYLETEQRICKLLLLNFGQIVTNISAPNQRMQITFINKNQSNKLNALIDDFEKKSKVYDLHYLNRPELNQLEEFFNIKLP